MEHKTISLADQVFERLEKEILTGKYQRGTVLTEMGLCTDLGVSRTPVREALRRLEQEHIVEMSGKGIVVLGVTQEDLADIYAIRLRIEGMAAALAARNITPEEAEELKEAVDLQEFYMTKKDADHIKIMDSRFHELIYRFSGSAVSNTTWCVTWSADTKGIYDMEVVATVNNIQREVKTTPVTVYGLKIGSATTSIDQSGNTLYILENEKYPSTYLTSYEINLFANSSCNYYNLFTTENGKIKSLARGTYCNGSNGSITFNASATSYSFATATVSGKSYNRITSSTGSSWQKKTTYLRQTSSTSVTISNTSSNNNWSIYPVTFDEP